jgi:hypothetical protein
MSLLLYVPVTSTTRPVSGGIETSAEAAKAQTQLRSSARKKAFAALIAANAGAPDYFAGAGAGLKSTLGTVETSFSFSTVKFGFSL